MVDQFDYDKKYDPSSDEFISQTLVQTLTKLTDKELEQFYMLSDSVKNHQSLVKSKPAIVKPNSNISLSSHHIEIGAGS